MPRRAARRLLALTPLVLHCRDAIGHGRDGDVGPGIRGRRADRRLAVEEQHLSWGVGRVARTDDDPVENAFGGVPADDLAPVRRGQLGDLGGDGICTRPVGLSAGGRAGWRRRRRVEPAPRCDQAEEQHNGDQPGSSHGPSLRACPPALPSGAKKLRGAVIQWRAASCRIRARSWLCHRAPRHERSCRRGGRIRRHRRRSRHRPSPRSGQ